MNKKLAYRVADLIGSESGCSEDTNEIGCNDTLQENIKLAPNMGTKLLFTSNSAIVKVAYWRRPRKLYGAR